MRLGAFFSLTHFCFSPFLRTQTAFSTTLPFYFVAGAHFFIIPITYF